MSGEAVVGVDWEQLALWDLCVFPLKPRDKRPIGAWEHYRDRKPSSDELRKWSHQLGLNVAVACGAISGVIVLDTDDDAADLDVQKRGVPTTPIVRTAKGRHYYFKHPGFPVRNFARRLPGLDLRGDGGYVVGAGSIHPSGHRYVWEVSPSDVPFAPAPQWLLELLKKKDKGAASGAPTAPPGTAYAEAALDKQLIELRRARPGQRNDTLFRSALALGQLVGAGALGQSMVEGLLRATAQSIGLDADEIEKTIASGMEKGIAEPREIPASARRPARPRAPKADTSGAAGGPAGDDPPPLDDDDPGPLPIVALGHRHGLYYVIAKSGEVRKLGVRDLSAIGMLSLFDGDDRWLKQAAPSTSKRGEDAGSFSARQAASWLMRLCGDAGLFDPSLPMRGPGIWPHNDGRTLVVHAGDQLWINGAWQPAGRRFADAIFPAFPKIQKPQFPGGAADIGKKMRQHLALWEFKHPFMGGLFLGLIAQMMLGAAPKWRVHGLLTSDRGSGKTTLLDYVVALLGPMAQVKNRFSEPGLRQLLNQQARTIVLDEAEGSSGRAQQMIELLRTMAGGKGMEGVLGSADGSGSSDQQSVTGHALIAAINPPMLTPQDRSRIFEFELKPLRADTTKEQAEAAVQWATENSAALRGRAIEGWQRFQDSLVVYHSVLMGEPHRCDQRQADLLGTLLAGRDMLLHDDPCVTDIADEVVEKIKSLIATMQMDDELDGNPTQCWALLLSRQVEHWTGGSKSTLGSLIQRRQMTEDTVNNNHLDEIMANYGVRMEVPKGEPPYVMVAHRHDGLTRIFAGSDWENGGWRKALSRLAGAEEPPNPRWFAGIKQRYVRVPSTWLPPPYDPPIEGEQS